MAAKKLALKKDRKKFVFSRIKFKNGEYFDIREHVLLKDEGKFVPTKKGICIPIEDLEDFTRLVKKVKKLKAEKAD